MNKHLVQGVDVVPSYGIFSLDVNTSSKMKMLIIMIRPRLVKRRERKKIN